MRWVEEVVLRVEDKCFPGFFYFLEFNIMFVLEYCTLVNFTARHGFLLFFEIYVFIYGQFYVVKMDLKI